MIYTRSMPLGITISVCVRGRNAVGCINTVKTRYEASASGVKFSRVTIYISSKKK